ncbi:CHASE3 domain-containing protein [Fibrella sp. HMF5335]|uniref:histidine kinase n=1 Tax=Fibrella rubiginis TaxID=2817060 RepID=A0A939JZN8_9BACT|nr:sensor histidine kinase [Fibrella rubiginis]MBO0935242.1 CHASE3 domain-containing protein [Fibrella rubiginis]
MSLFADLLPAEPTSRRIVVGFTIAMLLVSVGFGMALYSYDESKRDNQRINHTFTVINAIGNVVSLLKDVETGARGYAATGLTSFLEPYQNARPQLVPNLNSLDSLLADNPVQRRASRQLRQFVLAKLATTDRQIRVGRQDTDSVRRAYLLEGKVRMDHVRQLSGVMIRHEYVLLAQRNARASRSYRNGLVVTFFLALTTFITLIILYNMLTTELRRRAENEQQLRTYEADLTTKLNQLEISNQELERFAFVASHDLQEPLRKISSFGTLLNERYGTVFDNDGRSFLGKMLSAAERMSTLIQDLLNFSRLANQPESFQFLPLSDVINRVIAELDLPLKETNAMIEVGPLPSLEMVPPQLEQLFSNLINNAMKYHRPDVVPHIQITADSVPGAAYPTLQPDQLYYQIFVTDNGIGFNEKYIDRIFNIFQRLHTKQQYEGTGIGLAICKRVVAYHQGYLTAHSQEGVGSTFVVVLPERQI